MDTSLNDQLNLLAEQISHLANSYADDNAKKLLDLYDELVDVANQAALKQFDENNEHYKEALAHIGEAMKVIEKGNKEIDLINKVMFIVGKALEQLVKVIASVF
jgi:hypothetical protein